ncbi:unnamed protein product [Meganyctiphanes norvegica]|uniref:BTB domain-containing protein n=1 Tax=Meganyctiphanes norvegica TaxID=48144 RepID=A0AAV2PS37_MEGNR
MAANGASSATTPVGQDAQSIANQMFPAIIELNVGGVFYTTTLTTLVKEQDSLLGDMFSGKSKQPVLRDSKGKFFIDRDGVLFRYVLDYLRNQKLVLPENFSENDRLKNEAEYYDLPDMVESLNSFALARKEKDEVPAPLVPVGTPLPKQREMGCVSVSYRGSFAFGRDGLADVKFRKLSRILVCGRVTLCREIFGETLNESRDPDRGGCERYTARFFLKHSFLEQAFDNLLTAGYRCAGSCGTSTAGSYSPTLKPGQDNEEDRWNHFNEYIWVRY